MAMDWLKGLVGPVAQFPPTGQPVPGAQGASPAFPPAYGAPAPGAQGGAPAGPPPGAWGPPPGAWDPSAPPVAGGAPQDPGSFGAPGAYSPPPAYGAPAYNAPSAYSPPPAYGAPPAGAGNAASGWGAAPASGPDARMVQLENRCEELRRDLESMALFAQTLLAVLEDKKVMTQQDFQEMRRKLDLLDGRLDDRIGKAG